MMQASGKFGRFAKITQTELANCVNVTELNLRFHSSANFSGSQIFLSQFCRSTSKLIASCNGFTPDHFVSLLFVSRDCFA